MSASVLPKRPADEADARARIDALTERTRAATFSTERADRPRAERAIQALYREYGRTEPQIIWVTSPAAGALAYGGVSAKRIQLRDPDATGAIGTGNGAAFNGLANPFPLPVGFVDRARSRIEARLDDLGMSANFGESVPAFETIRAATRAGAEALVPHDLVTGRPDPHAATELGRAVIGDAIDRLVDAIGIDLVGQFVWEAVQRKFTIEIVGTGRIAEAVQAMQPGQFDAVTPRIAAIEQVFGAPYWRIAARRDAIRRSIDLRLEIADSAGPWWALDGLAIVSERPLRLEADDRRRPHCEDGPAIAYGDGWTIHAWHGVRIEPWIVEEPDRISVELIDAQQNAEVRRVMVERFGAERLVREGGAELVSADEVGRLWRRQLDGGGWPREEPIVMVEVLNSTPEPDGSRKTYFLRVPPRMQTAREAVAWTFGLHSGEYRPAAQT